MVGPPLTGSATEAVHALHMAAIHISKCTIYYVHYASLRLSLRFVDISCEIWMMVVVLGFLGVILGGAGVFMSVGCREVPLNTHLIKGVENLAGYREVILFAPPLHHQTKNILSVSPDVFCGQEALKELLKLPEPQMEIPTSFFFGLIIIS